MAGTQTRNYIWSDLKYAQSTFRFKEQLSLCGLIRTQTLATMKLLEGCLSAQEQSSCSLPRQRLWARQQLLPCSVVCLIYTSSRQPSSMTRAMPPTSRSGARIITPCWKLLDCRASMALAPKPTAVLAVLLRRHGTFQQVFTTFIFGCGQNRRSNGPAIRPLRNRHVRQVTGPSLSQHPFSLTGVRGGPMQSRICCKAWICGCSSLNVLTGVHNL